MTQAAFDLADASQPEPAIESKRSFIVADSDDRDGSFAGLRIVNSDSKRASVFLVKMSYHAGKNTHTVAREYNVGRVSSRQRNRFQPIALLADPWTFHEAVPSISMVLNGPACEMGDHGLYF